MAATRTLSRRRLKVVEKKDPYENAQGGVKEVGGRDEKRKKNILDKNTKKIGTVRGSNTGPLASFVTQGSP